MVTDVVHVITPGDHFSPRTGSAIPTVVHGLAAASWTDTDWPSNQFVAIEASTYQPRYDSATAIEYMGVRPPLGRERLADVVLARLGRPRRSVAASYRPISGTLSERPPAIVLAHNAPILPWLLRDSPHRVVLYAHNDLLRTFSRSEAGRVLRTAAAIVCVSESLAERTRRALPRRLASLVHVVENGVDAVRFSPVAGVSTIRSTSTGLRVMFVGRMVAEKGPDVLVRAAAILGRNDLEFVFVGSQGFDRSIAMSRYEQHLRRLASESSARITFEPFVDRGTVAETLRTADILVVPSRWAEPSGLTVGEGLATGLPVVASRVGGIPEAMGSAGVLIPPDDPVALAGSLEALACDAGLRARLGAAGRARAVARDWSWAWSNLRDILRGL